MRPHVLWFDELYTSHLDFQWPRVVEASCKMGLLLAIGTSFAVGVTELLLTAAHSRRVPVITIDPNADNASTAPNTIRILERAELLLPILCNSLNESSKEKGELA